MKNLQQDNKTLAVSAPIGQPSLELTGLFQDILQRGVKLRVRVTGRSMIPFLRGNEVLTIRQEPCLSLSKGDLILFRSTYELPVLHRILRIRKEDDGALWFLTKGDALMAFDEEIHQSRVLGKVLRVECLAASGKSRQIDMNSLFYRCLNFSIALKGLFKTQTYFFLSGAVSRKTLKKLYPGAFRVMCDCFNSRCLKTIMCFPDIQPYFQKKAA